MNKKIIFLIVIIIASLFIGMSYGLWQIVKTQEGTNQAISKCFSITMSEDSSSIKLTKAYPISNEEAKSLTPYTFTISNNCPIAASYKINLETLNTSNIDLKFLRVSINNSKSQIISSYIEDTPTLKNISKSNTILVDYLAGNTSKTYDFRIWLDYNTTQYDLNNDGTDKWAGKITVQASAISDQDLLAVCKSSGGDFMVDGECRKFYVKKNQLAINGNFPYNTDGIIKGSETPLGKYLSDLMGWWYNNYNEAELSISNNIFSTTVSNTYMEGPYFAVNNTIGNKYFLSATLKANIPFMRINIESQHGILTPSYVSPLDWTTYTYYWTETSQNYAITFYNTQPAGTGAAGTMYLKNIFLIDLTLMFGEGYEPSQEWCDANLNSYFDYDREGTLIPISDLGYDIETGYYDIVSLT